MSAPHPPSIDGQAFVESLVAIVFLIPLLLCMVYLADLMRAEEGAVAAARQLALAAMHEPSGHLDPSTLKKLQDISLPVDGLAGEALAPRVGQLSLPNSASDVEKAARGLLLPADSVGIGRFDLPDFAARQSSTEISLGSTRDLGVTIDIPVVVRSSVAFLAGHGAASAPSQVRTRTAALSVAGTLGEVAEPIELLATIASLLEPSLRRLCIGRIDPEIVPADRLPVPATRSSDLRYQPC